MKRWSGLYPQIYDFSTLEEAYRKARRGRRFQDEVLAFSSRLEENLIQLQNELIWRTYQPGRYREFYVYDPKKRLVMALPFRDRVVQWAIYMVLNPLFDRQYIADSYACRVGRGTHASVDRLQYWLRYLDRRHDRVYALHLDVSKYFYRVDHEVLREILARKIKDRGVLWLLDVIIRHEGERFGLPVGADCDGPRVQGVGMPIGNLTSQMFANLYLNEADQYAKHRLQVRYYLRYMDDILILDWDKARLRAVRQELEEFLWTRLHLEVNAKTSVQPISHGVDWCGYRVWPTHRLVRRRTKVKMRRRLRRLQTLYARGEVGLDKVRATIHSYIGHLKRCDAHNLLTKVLRETAFVRSADH